ncbi:MAG: hypothetical protein OEW96_12865 [Betaproteobacteria bacterium]|nr:hypothetical protein [Betaproteobacteria bacterium]MDH5212553.1 hypothetical protein [Betaproteobacteria bacterium]
MTLLKLVAAALALCAVSPALAVGSIAEVSVYDRSDGRHLPVYWHQGEAYVVGRPGSEYRIQVRNREGADVLAVMSVDGVNVITGESAHPQQSGYVLAPRGRLEVKGWRKSLARTAAFYFTELGDSYAARSGRPENVGVIGVALFRKKPEPPPQPFGGLAPAPRAEARSSREAADGAQALGTGHGRIETSHARHVVFERASAHPAETVTIRYDSYRNLVAMGVIRAAQPQPQAFPGFVPDA